MTNFWRFLVFGGSGYFLILLCRLAVYGHFPTHHLAAGLLLAFIFAGAGFLTGLIIFEFKLRPAHLKNRIFLFSHIFFLALLAAISLFLSMKQRNPSPVNYAQRNREAVQFFNSENRPHIEAGYELLLKQFNDSNAFSLERISTRAKDTTIGSASGEGHQLLFVYQLVQQPGMQYYSKIFVLHQTARMQVHLQRLGNDPASMEIRQEGDSTNKDAYRMLKEAEKMIDSLHGEAP